MNEQLFIPETLKVGYQERSDTYTKKLAYVIYYDNKGKLRKEASWESWRDKKIDADEFKNVPAEGFVINRNGGGKNSGWGWNDRTEFVRVFDPRGFEIEISLPNLLYILQENNSIKGKGLEGEFVYGWAGTTLCLLPVGSEEYKKCTVYTKLQDEKVSAKELVPGLMYETKKQQKVVYMGKFTCYNSSNYYYDSQSMGVYQNHVFVKAASLGKKPEFEHMTDTKTIAHLVSDVPVEEFADLMDKLTKHHTIGTIKAVSHVHGKINFVEDVRDRYSYSSDPSGISGHEYKYRVKDVKLEQKYSHPYFKKISANSWQVINLYRIREEVEGKDNYERENYFNWKHKGYQLRSSKILVLENDELKYKASKFQDDTIYTKSDIQKMELLSLKIVLKNGKSHDLN